MKQQIVAIHGGDSFATYGEYLKSLWWNRSRLNSLLSFSRRTRSWKRRLGETLGEEYEVILPWMPNAHNAKYREWKARFEKLIPHIRNEVILIGHSLGASFLAKYLSENDFPKKIKATLLVSGPYDTDSGRILAQFNITSSLGRLEKQGGKLFVYHSKDDPVVAFVELAKFQQQLPSATSRIFEDRQHFNQEEFPELVEDIKALSLMSQTVEVK
jgi:predicted alpha/beta hydrolase family esterase